MLSGKMKLVVVQQLENKRVCICNSMGRSEIWDKFTSCSENGSKIARGIAKCNLSFSLR